MGSRSVERQIAPDQDFEGTLKYRVLVVDDEPAVGRLLRRILEDQGYGCELAREAEEALQRAGTGEFSVIMTDVRMPGRDGLELLEDLRRGDPEAVVIMITGRAEIDSAIHALRLGAYDYITKPFRREQILASVGRGVERRRFLEERRTYQERLEREVRQRTEDLRQALKELTRTYRMTLEALAAALDLRDVETMAHSRRVADLALAIAREIGRPREELVELERGALLHDIGKIGIPDAILRKPGPLTEEEWTEIKNHCHLGYEMVKPIPFLSRAAEIILAHQERYDGTGYPRGLTGEEIPLGARIFAVADAFDVITSNRPYRRARSLWEAREEIQRHSGTQFDPNVVEAFLRIPERRLREILQCGWGPYEGLPQARAEHPKQREANGDGRGAE